LASQSPRRKALLENLGLTFQVQVSPGEETHPSADSIEEGVMLNAFAKAAAVGAMIPDPGAVVIGADTLVVVDGVVLGKPSGVDQAKQALRQLSGRSHAVLTGLALFSSRYGLRKSYERTVIHFRPLSEQTIEEYTKTREPYDKAGAYGIQGMASLFVERVEGSYTNVVGLPIEKLLSELEQLTSIPVYRWFE
jgi:septum formation protein